MKKDVLICIILFMLCMIIEPGTASFPDNSVAEKIVANASMSVPIQIISEPTETRFLNVAISEKENLTDAQKKLSSALLMQFFSSENVSPQIRSLYQPALLLKNVQVNNTYNESLSVSSNVSSENLVYAYINVKPDFSTHIIDPFVYQVLNRDEAYHLAVAWVNVQNLETLASVDGVRTIREVLPPKVNIGSVTTAGDIIHKTADARSKYGNSGAGMKIGIISDGVDNLTDSQAKGDLPNDVTVLSNTQGGDEGTAMLEIVHDMVPDAKLYFHDCGDNQLSFNDAIDALVTHGCTVICDDINFPDEYYFEDGPIASHMMTLSENIIFVSSSGNSASSDPYDSMHHYQGAYVRSGSTNWHDFSRGTNTTYQELYFLALTGTQIQIVLQWDDRWGQSGNNFDLYLYNATGGIVTYHHDLQTGSGNPIEVINGIWNGPSQLMRINVLNVNGLAQPKNLEIYIMTYPAYFYPINIVRTDSIFGHQAVPDVITVAAVPASSPTTIEPFSSQGPVTITYPSPVFRQKPDITGVDGVSITGAGGFPNPFFGTSASSPHIAAIVAQNWGGHSSLTPAQVRNALYTTVDDLGPAGYDTIFGYGRANSLAMADSLNINKTRICVFRNGSWYFDFNGNNIWDGSPLDKLVTFGTAGDIPVKGDWNSNSRDEIGLFRSPGVWILDANGNYLWDSSVTDRMFAFGAIGDQPVVGDWTRDGITKIGLFRSPGVWILDYNGNNAWDGTPTDRIIGFGAVGDTAVAGDWNRDGNKEIGLFRSSGIWIFDYNANYNWDGTPTDRIIGFGAVGDIPVVGDWNGDGLDEIGVYRNGIWILDYNANNAWDGTPIDRILAYNPNGGNVPEAGNWN